MKVNKAALTVHGDALNIAMPIVKVDKQNRTVSGFATLDNVDTQKDIVTAEASNKAFTRWRGNIREMHAPKAVGKALKFEEKSFFNPEDNKTYKGVYVTAYVSTGAQDTWEKVLDGTLTGFSIGGAVIKSESLFDKDSGSAFRKVTDYEMHELSLVDNPANQLANIMSIQKHAGGESTLEGMVSKMAIENIFWCPIDKVSTFCTEEDLTCTSCDSKMENIGWVEAQDENKDEVMAKAVAAQVSNQPMIWNSNTATTTTGMQTGTYNFTSRLEMSEETAEQIAKQVAEYLQGNKGGVDVSKRTDNKVEKSAGTEEVKPEAVAEDSPTAGPAATNADVEVDPASGEVTEAAEVEEVEEPNLAKMFSDLQESLAGAIETSKADTQKTIGDFQSSLEKSVGEVNGKVSELETKLTELDSRVSSLSENVETVEKRVGGVEDESAIKKSGDLGGSKDDKIEKNTQIWRGSFLSANDLVK